MARVGPLKQKCRACSKLKRIEEFGWSRHRGRPTKTCIACQNDPSMARKMMGSESTRELVLYYSHVRSMMEDLNAAQAERISKGLPVDRPLKNLGDVWVSELTEEAYREIVQALIRKASNGDVNASKLLLEERHRRAGEPTSESVQESFEELFKIDPLTPNMDSE